MYITELYIFTRTFKNLRAAARVGKYVVIRVARKNELLARSRVIKNFNETKNSLKKKSLVNNYTFTPWQEAAARARQSTIFH